MPNLLTETVEVLESFGKKPSDVDWVGGVDVWFSWEEFAAVADVIYDSEYGGQEVASDLVVVGNGWWMVRSEYDGSEWWEFVEPMTKPERHIVPRNLLGQWDTVASLHDGGNYRG